MSEELKDALARIACLEGEIAKRDETIVNAAPVSEAKAQGVVMPKRIQIAGHLSAVEAYRASGWNQCLDEVARLNAAPVQQVSVPDGWKLVPVEPTLDMGWAYVDAANDASTGKRNSFNHFGYRAMLDAAPAAPAIGAGVTTHD